MPEKSIRPIWDRDPPAPEPEPVAPRVTPPLPPAHLFERDPRAALSPDDLPSFEEVVPHDYAAIEQRMREAQDASDAARVLRELGIGPPTAPSEPEPIPQPLPPPKPKHVRLEFTRDPTSNRIDGVRAIYDYE